MLSRVNKYYPQTNSKGSGSILLGLLITWQPTNQPIQRSSCQLHGVVWYGLRNATDLWQDVDAGIAQTLKALVGQNHQQWLDEGNNMDLWYGHEEGLTSMQRRILITHWIGSAWNTLCGADYANLRARCWEKTGCLMTADGSKDERIPLEGLPNYRIPPPILY